MLLFVPLATFKEEAVDVGTILRALLELLNLLGLRDEVELEPIDRRSILLSREALEEGCGKASGERECTDPEANRLALGHPRFEELVALAQILLPVAERLRAEVSEVPLSWNFVLSERRHHPLEIRSDEVKTLYTELELVEGALDHAHEVVVALHFLDKDDIERVRVTSG